MTGTAIIQQNPRTAADAQDAKNVHRVKWLIQEERQWSPEDKFSILRKEKTMLAPSNASSTRRMMSLTAVTLRDSVS
ncbi:hypothetical protein PROFUN_05792 [Planoprotostelium fungivorum]|uniref:Uncharacterized protein n=1 Tax=Planoprotostelium fungivorum TaxID=1890364 RepID=A0A2P6NPY0_9EUKA|nr:hypothetical protein PROFUN_05792 [Planoprotostelium fungivorum]